MAAVFADTFFFIALLDSSDPHHTRAVAWSRSKSVTFVTTDYVLIELGDAFHQDDQRGDFVLFYEILRKDPKFRIVSASPSLLAKGFHLYSRRRDKGWQLTDCLSFVVMKERRIRDALTGDRHFEQAGFRAIFHNST